MKITKYLIIAIICLTTGCSKKTINLIKLGDELDIHTDLQQEYLYGDFKKATSYADGTKELSKPRDIQFTWKVNKNKFKEAGNFINYIVEISENKDMSNSKVYEVNEEQLSLTNFKIATSYYWTVTANYENSYYTSEIEKFTTIDMAPRNLNIDGVTNFRDIGGWKTIDGKRVKQGMLYRSGRLNESDSDIINVEVTNKGIETLKYELGIKSEIDVRKVDNNEVGSITSSVIGKDINYLSAPMEYNGNILIMNNEAVKKIFEFLGNEENYPAIIHCNIGTDRTGMLAYIINGLLGVDLDSLYTDYMFSNFGKIGGTRHYSTIFSTYGTTIDICEGETLSDRIYNYLVSIGVESEDLYTIKRIMLE